MPHASQVRTRPPIAVGTAVALLDCTQPGVFEARRRMLAELDAINAVDRAPSPSRLPQVLAVPKC